jgi:hypothetical protein
MTTAEASSLRRSQHIYRDAEDCWTLQQRLRSLRPIVARDAHADTKAGLERAVQPETPHSPVAQPAVAPATRAP